MREAGEPSAWVQQCAVRSVVPAPPGIAMVAPPTVPRNAEGAQSERPRCLTRGGEDNAANNTRIIKAGVLHLASLQRGSLILRESCYNVVTRPSTVGNDLVVPDSKRERGVHARYALLGTRSAGGGSCSGNRLGAVPIGPPLALAASRGPGLTHRRLPRPVNGERGAG
jgi:hypothetical protein